MDLVVHILTFILPCGNKQWRYNKVSDSHRSRSRREATFLMALRQNIKEFFQLTNINSYTRKLISRDAKVIHRMLEGTTSQTFLGSSPFPLFIAASLQGSLLKDVKLFNQPQVTAKAVLPLFMNCPNVRRIEISHCSSFSAVDLMGLLTALDEEGVQIKRSQLRYLNLDSSISSYRNPCSLQNLESSGPGPYSGNINSPVEGQAEALRYFLQFGSLCHKDFVLFPMPCRCDGKAEGSWRSCSLCHEEFLDTCLPSSALACVTNNECCKCKMAVCQDCLPGSLVLCEQWLKLYCRDCACNSNVELCCNCHRQQCNTKCVCDTCEKVACLDCALDVYSMAHCTICFKGACFSCEYMICCESCYAIVCMDCASTYCLECDSYLAY
jgi:hypothetical protein